MRCAGMLSSPRAHWSWGCSRLYFRRVSFARWNPRTLKNGFRRLTKDLSYTLGRVLQVAEALQFLHNDAIPGLFV